MTADEIRELAIKPTKNAKEEGDIGIRILAEIAAQLAQLNAGLETITGYQTLKVQIEPGQYPIVVEVRK